MHPSGHPRVLPFYRRLTNPWSSPRISCLPSYNHQSRLSPFLIIPYVFNSWKGRRNFSTSSYLSSSSSRTATKLFAFEERRAYSLSSLPLGKVSSVWFARSTKSIPGRHRVYLSAHGRASINDQVFRGGRRRRDTISNEKIYQEAKFKGRQKGLGRRL